MLNDCLSEGDVVGQAKSIFKIRKLGFALRRGEEGIQRCSYRRSLGPPPGSRGQTAHPEIRPGCGSSATLKQEGQGLKPDLLPPLIAVHARPTSSTGRQRGERERDTEMEREVRQREREGRERDIAIEK